MITNLIIPMAGMGSRFVRGGYKVYKPFLKCHNRKTIIENIINNFDVNTKKFFIVSKSLDQKYINKLKKIPKSKIIYINKHKLGPAYSLYKAKKEIKKLKNIYVSYSDINWKWKKKKLIHNKNIIFTFKGWHPYTYNSNNYAFCKTYKNKLLRIKEKSSFTKNWQSEPLSIGLFYYKNSNDLLLSLDKILKKNIKTNNEFFPSEGFNFIKKNSHIKYVNSFVHLGAPKYYEQYIDIERFFSIYKNFQKKIKKYNLANKIIIPAAGMSKRFRKEGIKVPKHIFFIKIFRKTMIDYISSFLPSMNKTLITINSKYNSKIDKKKYNIFNLYKKTKGQADTVYNYLEKFNLKDSFFINSCDVFSIFNLKKYKTLVKKSDIIVFASKKSFIELPEKSYSWVEIYKDKLKNIYIKNKPKENLKILTGNFYFKNKLIFIKSYKKIKKEKKEIFIDDLVSEALKLNLKVNVIIDDVYINLGTPTLLKNFIFWNNLFNKSR